MDLGARLRPPPLDSSAGDHATRLRCRAGGAERAAAERDAADAAACAPRALPRALRWRAAVQPLRSREGSARRSSIAPAAIDARRGAGAEGRETEVSALERRIDDLAARCGGGVLIVEGEAGVTSRASCMRSRTRALLGVAAVAECADAGAAALGGHGRFGSGCCRAASPVSTSRLWSTSTEGRPPRREPGAAATTGGGGGGAGAYRRLCRRLVTIEPEDVVKLEGRARRRPRRSAAAAAEEGEEEATPRPLAVGAQPMDR